VGTGRTCPSVPEEWGVSTNARHALTVPIPLSGLVLKPEHVSSTTGPSTASTIPTCPPITFPKIGRRHFLRPTSRSEERRRSSRPWWGSYVGRSRSARTVAKQLLETSSGTDDRQDHQGFVGPPAHPLPVRAGEGERTHRPGVIVSGLAIGVEEGRPLSANEIAGLGGAIDAVNDAHRADLPGGHIWYVPLDSQKGSNHR
jgi:hypothetical protein